jgi:hypothetical protein
MNMLKQLLLGLALTFIAEVMVMAFFDITPQELCETYANYFQQEGP